MEILKLKPAYKDYIWGGTKLKTSYNKKFEGGRLAECWELSCHPDGPSVIGDGEFKGRTLREYIEKKGKSVLGSNCLIFDDFPILIKFIDAKDNLSIQVHPNNIYALENENQYGKTEAWYVLEAEPGAFLYYGFKYEISKDEFRRRVNEGTLTEVLNAVPVKKGDSFYIPAGTIHAIGKDIVIAEIQQSSNVTYRVYDYGRIGLDGRPRELHIDKAIEVTRLMPPEKKYNFGGHLIRSLYFTIDIIEAPYSGFCDDESFTSVLVTEGSGKLESSESSLEIQKGDSLFIPAGIGKYMVSGNAKALQTRIGTI